MYASLETPGASARRAAARRRLALLVAAAVLLPASAVYADSESESTGWMVAVKTGRANLEADYSTSLFQSFDDSSDAWSVGGGYRFSRHFSVEGWYSDPVEFDGGGGLCPPTEGCAALFVPSRASLETLALRALGHLPVGRRVDLYSFAGPLAWDLEIVRFVPQLSPPFPRFDDSDVDLAIGAGLGVRLVRGFSAFAEYEHVDYSQFDVDGSAWLGLRWRS